MTTSTDFSLPSANAVKFVRRFAFDRDTLWAMWTQAHHLQNWWGPHGFTTPVCEVDFQPGGSWFYCMQDAKCQRYCGKMIYLEIEAPRRFSATDVFTDEAGNIVSDMPEAHSEFAFAAAQSDTIFTNVSRYRSKVERDQVVAMGVEAGVRQTLDRLDAYLAALAE